MFNGNIFIYNIHYKFKCSLSTKKRCGIQNLWWGCDLNAVSCICVKTYRVPVFIISLIILILITGYTRSDSIARVRVFKIASMFAYEHMKHKSFICQISTQFQKRERACNSYKEHDATPAFVVSA